MTNSILIALSVMIVSCSKSEAPAGPTDAIMATYKALEAQDSAAFMESLSQDKKDAMNPDHLHELLDHWKGRHATLKVLSIQQNDTMATVLYDLTVTGPNARSHDSIYARAYLENGVWKHGY